MRFKFLMALGVGMTLSACAGDDGDDIVRNVEASEGFIVLGASDDGVVKVEVPDGSNAVGVEVTVKRVDGDAAEDPLFEGAVSVIEYDLGPDGYRFDEPVTVSFSLNLAEIGIEDGQYPQVVLASSPDDRAFESLDGIDMRVGPDTIVFSVEVLHFSRYVLAFGPHYLFVTAPSGGQELPVGDSVSLTVSSGVRPGVNPRQTEKIRLVVNAEAFESSVLSVGPGRQPADAGKTATFNVTCMAPGDSTVSLMVQDAALAERHLASGRNLPWFTFWGYKVSCFESATPTPTPAPSTLADYGLSVTYSFEPEDRRVVWGGLSITVKLTRDPNFDAEGTVLVSLISPDEFSKPSGDVTIPAAGGEGTFSMWCTSKGDSNLSLTVEYEDISELTEFPVECRDLGTPCFTAWDQVPLNGAKYEDIRDTFEACEDHDVWRQSKVGTAGDSSTYLNLPESHDYYADRYCKESENIDTEFCEGFLGYTPPPTAVPEPTQS